MSTHPAIPTSGLHLPIGRRSLIKASAILAGAGLIGIKGRPLWAADLFKEVRPRWQAAQIDWMQEQGKSITLAGVQHPWMNAVTPLLPHFTKLTGIEVEVQTQSETEYTAELPVKLGAKSATPDVYMVWAIGQAITAGWLEPLGPYLADKNLTDASWWDGDDLFPSAQAFQTWSDGQQYLMAITAESQVLFVNRTLLEAVGGKVPTSSGTRFGSPSCSPWSRWRSSSCWGWASPSSCTTRRAPCRCSG